jgi:hypothetical protein
VNSEELELSLRSEFEAHIKTVLADVQQQVSDFQQKIDSELEKHRSQMAEALKDFSARISAERPMDKAFRETVVEHLRLARDDGARVAASAIAEAETMGADSARSASFNLTRDAVNEISSQTSQSAILRTLVDYAEQFCPRGVFFIVRNEHFVGWQALGRDVNTDEAAVRELNFAVASDNVLSEAVRTLTTVEHGGSNNSGDGVFLDPLGFGRPSKMYAIPLVARGRGVAALYVDGGKAEQPINIEALEMLVRVASLTVELLASNQAARPQVAEAETAQAKSEPETMARVSEPEASSFEPAPAYKPEPEHMPEPEYKFETPQQLEAPATEPEIQEEVHVVPAYEVETFQAAPDETVEVQEIEVEAQAIEPEHETYTEVSTDFAFRSADDHEIETPADEPVTHEEPAPAFTSGNGNGNGAAAFEPAPPETSRVTSGTRRLDLPIEVSEAERGTHTKARRFARLLVSEIKLYNEDKVREGRQSGDLYDRLREAIDRSREMYDKRVESPVAERFDYFHYELVNDLAEGDPARLGNSYPGGAA